MFMRLNFKYKFAFFDVSTHTTFIHVCTSMAWHYHAMYTCTHMNIDIIIIDVCRCVYQYLYNGRQLFMYEYAAKCKL